MCRIAFCGEKPVGYSNYIYKYKILSIKTDFEILSIDKIYNHIVDQIMTDSININNILSSH